MRSPSLKLDQSLDRLMGVHHAITIWNFFEIAGSVKYLTRFNPSFEDIGQQRIRVGTRQILANSLTIKKLEL